ncbi:amidase [Kribbella capetownensis]|uniref:amidase n=1 Tax=Kribbella capetownensis TaxID=1572659 RepID=UPI001EDDAF0B|nr:amidase [Kribbella capetownensis]
MQSLEEIAADVRAGKLDPVELVRTALIRAEDTAETNAVVHLDADGALQRAARHDRSGALAGVPVLMKEIVEVEGLPYRCGSASMDEVGQQDADVVRRLRAAGAIIIGLSHTHEFAYGCTGTSNRLGPCRNPHDLARMTGGSSAGAGAAVAAGVVPLAIGTDTAGSVRIPAALCGVVGFKPAYGTVSADRVFPLSQSLDHVGVLTSTVADAVYAMSVLSDTAFTGAPPVRLGVVTNPEYLDFTDEVGAAWTAALGRLSAAGVELVGVELPDWGDSFTTAAHIQGPEAVANHAGRSMAQYQPDVQERLREAAEVTPADYDAAVARAIEITAEMERVLAGVDAVLTPTVLCTAPLIADAATPEGSKAIRSQLLKNTRLANLTKHPAVSLPLPTEGLPVGLQLIAPTNNQAAATAHWLESQLS